MSQAFSESNPGSDAPRDTPDALPGGGRSLSPNIVDAAYAAGFQQVFETTLTIRWGDMDAYGHVNNSVYFAYMDQVRLEWLQSLGIPLPVEHGPAVVNAFMNYRRQLHYPARIVCTLLARPPGNSSIETRFWLRREDALESVVADGGATIVWTDYKAGRSVAWPKAWSARLPIPR